ncbi:MAG: ribosome-associated translation inhibitor RaiA [Proteobacteria bacterium]|nr:ribosome-associated translation inhibitor RaiA [Pseudomonadota bacterium]
MRIETSGHQIDVTPALRDYVNAKFDRLARYADGDLDIRVTLRVAKVLHAAEARIVAPGATHYAECEADTMYAAIDLLTDKLDRMLDKHKGKQVKHHRSDGAARSESFG